MLTIAKMDRYDTVNAVGEEVAFTIWFSGCSIGCSDCQNQVLWDRAKGQEYEVGTVVYAVCSECAHSGVNTVVLLGGEPLEQDNTDLLKLASKLKENNMRIWLYTGMEFEDIPMVLRNYLDVIKTGRYDSSLSQEGFPASSNQKLWKKNDDGKWD